MRALSLSFLLPLSAICAVAQAAGTITHPVANLEVKPPPGWNVSYCTISGPTSAYSWATPTNGEICHFSYLNYAGTYTVTVTATDSSNTAITTSAAFTVTIQ